MANQKRAGSSRPKAVTGLSRDTLQEDWGTEDKIIIGYPFTGAVGSCSAEELLERIEGDIRELASRAYHLSRDQWEGKPTYPQRVLPMRLAKVMEDQRSRIRELKSSANADERREGEALHKEMLEADQGSARKATVALGAVGQLAARLLERLGIERTEIVRKVAPQFSSWPVNLKLGKHKKNGKRELMRVETVKAYLRRIDANATVHWPRTECPESDAPSRFRVAADQLYERLRLTRQEQLAMRFEAFGGSEKNDLGNDGSQWATALRELQEPMTETNAKSWWSVAKVWLDEDWQKNPADFVVLIAACKSRGKPLGEAACFESERRRTVIDTRFKEAFLALARPSQE